MSSDLKKKLSYFITTTKIKSYEFLRPREYCESWSIYFMSDDISRDFPSSEWIGFGLCSIQCFSNHLNNKTPKLYLESEWTDLKEN